MSFISDLFGGTKPSFQTQNVVDPLKQNVANPLSSYLSSQVGQGIPTYQGNQGAATEPFMNMSVDQVYQDYAAPATQEFENLLPQIEEQDAGALSGSGRELSETTAASNFSLSLAQTKEGLETSVPEAQQVIESQQYQQWYQGLAQNNPALGEALQFLNNSTSTGTTVLSALNPGQEGLGDQLVSEEAQNAVSNFGIPNLSGSQPQPSGQITAQQINSFGGSPGQAGYPFQPYTAPSSTELSAADILSAP